MRAFAIAILLSACGAHTHAPAAIGNHVPAARPASASVCAPSTPVRVYGCLYDQTHGRPLVGATILVTAGDGTQTAVTSDEHGEYEVNVPGEIVGFDVYYLKTALHIDDHVDASETHHRVPDTSLAVIDEGETIQIGNGM